MTDDASDRGVHGERLVLSMRRRDELDRVEDRIVQALGRYGFDDHARFAILTALGEALSNAVLHGNLNDPAKALTVEYSADASTVAIVVEDEGAGFDPAAVPDPTRPENVDIPSGRGIMLMRAYMTEVEYDPPGNRVRMTYRR
ncbi:MAG: ATP-binding protein [Planctomycetota bacterium]|jgi:serine/threonine-protein kinase RsbW